MAWVAAGWAGARQVTGELLGGGAQGRKASRKEGLNLGLLRWLWGRWWGVLAGQGHVGLRSFLAEETQLKGGFCSR